jgi:hypothetical protein
LVTLDLLARFCVVGEPFQNACEIVTEYRLHLEFQKRPADGKRELSDEVDLPGDSEYATIVGQWSYSPNSRAFSFSTFGHFKIVANAIDPFDNFSVVYKATVIRQLILGADAVPTLRRVFLHERMPERQAARLGNYGPGLFGGGRNLFLDKETLITVGYNSLISLGHTH